MKNQARWRILCKIKDQCKFRAIINVLWVNDRQILKLMMECYPRQHVIILSASSSIEYFLNSPTSIELSEQTFRLKNDFIFVAKGRAKNWKFGNQKLSPASTITSLNCRYNKMKCKKGERHRERAQRSFWARKALKCSFELCARPLDTNFLRIKPHSQLECYLISLELRLRACMFCAHFEQKLTRYAWKFIQCWAIEWSSMLMLHTANCLNMCIFNACSRALHSYQEPKAH